MDTHEKFLSYLEDLISKKITLAAISEKTGIDYNRLRNIKNLKVKARDPELRSLEQAYFIDLNIKVDYSGKGDNLLIAMESKIKAMEIKEENYLNIIEGLSEVIEAYPVEDEEINAMLRELKEKIAGHPKSDE